MHGHRGAVRTWEQQPRHRPSRPLTCRSSNVRHTSGIAASSIGNRHSTRVARSAHLRKQLTLAESLRADGRARTEIATILRDRYGLNARVAMRLAHGWTQAATAQEWNRRWPDHPKTFKNISYWENWPSPTGHMPSLLVLDRLAQLYGCNVTDLVARLGRARCRSGW